MDTFTTIFLFTQKAPSLFADTQGQLNIGVIALSVGLTLFFFASIAFIAKRISLAGRFLFPALFIIVWGVNWYNIYSQDYQRLKETYTKLESIYNHQEYQVVEGVVHVLHTQPTEGHDKGDIISVNNVEFDINFFFITFGYNQTLAHGGRLSEGVTAKIYYYEDETAYYYKNTILRVDLQEP